MKAKSKFIDLGSGDKSFIIIRYVNGSNDYEEIPDDLNVHMLRYQNDPRVLNFWLLSTDEFMTSDPAMSEVPDPEENNTNQQEIL